MRRILLFITFALPAAVLAQETPDSIIPIENKVEMVSISLNDLTKLKSERDQAVNRLRELTSSYITVYRNDSIKSGRIITIEAKVDSLKESYEKIKSNNDKANKSLINIASNFLYIPYEAYSIEKIAIPAFEIVSDRELREKHAVGYKLLKNYQRDIRALLSFIKQAKEKLNAQWALRTPDVKNGVLNDLQAQGFYTSYKEYKEWQETFLGKQIVKVENVIKTCSDSNKPVFDDIEIQLNNCLNSINDL